MNVYVKSVDEDSMKAMQALDALVCAKRELDNERSEATRPN